MNDELKKTDCPDAAGPETVENTISEDWPHETIEALDDFIESQGVYLRQ